jgi:DNA-binding MarR family transcriptional regulator
MSAPPLDERLVNIVGALAVALSDAVESATSAAAGQTGATPAGLVVLLDLLAGRSVDDLRHAVDLTHSGGVRMVDRLVVEGLAERRRGADARSIAIFLTPRGRRLARHAREARRAALAEVLGVLDDHEQEQLTRITEKLIGAVVARRLEVRAAGHEPAGGWLCRLCDPLACGRPDGACPAARTATDWRSAS